MFNVELFVPVSLRHVMERQLTTLEVANHLKKSRKRSYYESKKCSTDLQVKRYENDNIVRRLTEEIRESEHRLDMRLDTIFLQDLR